MARDISRTMTYRGWLRSCGTKGGLRLDDVQFFNARPEGARIESETDGGSVRTFDTPTGVLKNRLDVAALYLL